MKARPIIGISCSQKTEDNSLYLWEAYVNAVKNAEGISIILPVIEDEKSIEQYVSLIDGLLLTGGVDIEPLYYGEETVEGYKRGWPVTPQRDLFELRLVRALIKADKPILGICRGHQMINVAAGGSLYQDISFQQENTRFLSHFQEAPWGHPTHNVEIDPISKLSKIIDTQTIRVNSLHHQSINTLAGGFQVSAKASDGTVEAIESLKNTFIMGVQWHPELLAEKDKNWIKLFKSFVEASMVGKLLLQLK